MCVAAERDARMGTERATALMTAMRAATVMAVAGAVADRRGSCPQHGVVDVWQQVDHEIELCGCLLFLISFFLFVSSVCGLFHFGGCEGEWIMRRASFAHAHQLIVRQQTHRERLESAAEGGEVGAAKREQERERSWKSEKKKEKKS